VFLALEARGCLVLKQALNGRQEVLAAVKPLAVRATGRPLQFTNSCSDHKAEFMHQKLNVRS
jgi:hypothetical protein